MSSAQMPIILLREGTENGQGQVINNINACVSVSDYVRTTLGPRGMDKLVVERKDKTTISNDGATIMNMLDIVYPAAKIMTDIAKNQDNDVGDGTNNFVILAAEFLKQAKQFVEDGAYGKAFEIIPQQLCFNAGIDGGDIFGECVRDNLEGCIWEPVAVKRNAINAATEAACVVLSENIKFQYENKNAAINYQKNGFDCGVCCFTTAERICFKGENESLSVVFEVAERARVREMVHLLAFNKCQKEWFPMVKIANDYVDSYENLKVRDKSGKTVGILDKMGGELEIKIECAPYEVTVIADDNNRINDEKMNKQKKNNKYELKKWMRYTMMTIKIVIRKIM